MKFDSDAFMEEHRRVARRYFIQAGVVGLSALELNARALSSWIMADDKERAPKKSPTTDKAGAQPDPYFTIASQFRDVSRGNPLPHALSEEKRRDVGLTRDTWSLEVMSDPEHPAKLGKQFKKADGTAIDFATLMKLSEKHTVRFAKVMTCLNLGCPLGMGLWEGVPLSEVVWMTQPTGDLRRVFYYGYHNDDPKQIFRSSLPIGRVLESPDGLPPVILCTKLNGEWLDQQRGGPVRIVVPETYGFKSIKWLTHVVLTNLPIANDTYAEQNNDVDSPLKTFAATLSIPLEVKSGDAIPISGYAQVGVSGLSKVQVSIEPEGTAHEDDPNFLSSRWQDAELLPAPTDWSSLSGGMIPAGTHGFDASGVPKRWPMRLTNAHWAVVLPSLQPGKYVFRCRTIDDNGHAQPMPRPFRKSGHAAIESTKVSVK
jgi:DMSO/TMAO reductase YedYZ molybdopterin-dependent catalytic subunit